MVYEVRNAGSLISKRFSPIETVSFLAQLESVPWANDKFLKIDEFIGSYAGTSKQPSIKSKQLGTVVSGFTLKEEKLKALRLLHTYVPDRENLGKMIEDTFGYFDQDEAKKMVGLR